MHAHRNYEEIILGCLVSDTNYFLETRETRNGLLLDPVVSSTDAIGGALMGFRMVMVRCKQDLKSTQTHNFANRLPVRHEQWAY